MTVKEHYDNHLGNFYSWFFGDFEKNKDTFKVFCIDNDVNTFDSKYAVDLGAGNGIQTMALAELGFKVKAVDFNNQLITELKSRIGKFPVEVFNDDIKHLTKYSHPQPALIVCCGDTLAHLDSFSEVQKLIMDSYRMLSGNGRLILSFRDYSTELDDTDRFIPVKSDSQRILTCFVEYFPDKLRVTDLLHELENGKWIQKVSSYYKVRISRDQVLGFLKESGFEIIYDNIENRMITIIAQKN